VPVYDAAQVGDEAAEDYFRGHAVVLASVDKLLGQLDYQAVFAFHIDLLVFFTVIG
jgi:hypothetical protein